VVAPHVDPTLPGFADLPHVSGENITSGTGELLDVRSASEDGMTSTKYLFSPGDVLYSKLRPYLRKVALVDFRGLCSADMYPIEADHEVLDPTFLKFLLLSDSFSAYANDESRRARMPKLNRQQLLSWETPIPPLPEQERIAAALREQFDAAARMRAAMDTEAGSLRRLATTTLENLLAGLRQAGCGLRRCGDVAAVTGGIQKSPARAPQAFHRPFLTVRNVMRGYLDLSEVEHMEVTPAELDRLRLRAGDLLVVEGNGSRDQIGRNALFRDEIDECVHQNHVIRVRPRRDLLNPDYLSLYLNSRQGMEQMLQRAMTTTGLHTLSVRKIESLEIPVPTLAQQDNAVESWAALVRQLDAASRAAGRGASEVDRLPAAILRAAFSPSLG
jgi:type I restriction enzyme S subunit